MIYTSLPTNTLIQGTLVLFDYQSLKGKAIVVGISSTSALGNQYILQTDQIISDVYPYTTFVCPERYIHEYRQ